MPAVTSIGYSHPHDPLILCRRLDIQGIYQGFRNPMSLGVIALLLGEALIFDNCHLVEYLVLVLAVQLVRVPLYERRLRNSFEAAGMGPQYEEYCNRVPRWLPRIGS